MSMKSRRVIKAHANVRRPATQPSVWSDWLSQHRDAAQPSTGPFTDYRTSTCATSPSSDATEAATRKAFDLAEIGGKFVRAGA